jgi:hypothetical protein
VRCRIEVSAKAHPHAVLYHLAGHAVVMARSDVPIFSVRVDARRRRGAIHALLQHRDPAEGRMPVERDIVCAYAGVAAQEQGCGRASWFGAMDDSHTGWRRVLRCTTDTGEEAAWGIYLRERARVVVRSCWHEITVVAGVLARGEPMDSASVGAVLAAFRANPLRRDLRPLPPIPWAYPRRDGGKDEVELLYTKPRLSALVARVRR